MTFTDLPQGSSIFVDANILVYYFGSHPTFGSACADLMRRIENKEVTGVTSAHVVNEMIHRLMATEAATLFGWPTSNIANRMRRHPAEVQQLSQYRLALQEIPLIGLTVPP